jgi:hypothetical protein
VRGLDYLSGEEKSFLTKDRLDLLGANAMLRVLCSIAGVPIEVVWVGNEVPQPYARLVIAR